MKQDSKRVIFIGNRHLVLQAIIDHPQLELVALFATTDSKQRIEGVQNSPVSPRWFEESDKSDIVEAIAQTEFDVLVSNGCPILLPISTLREPRQHFLNVHPSLLPDNRGRHPANGVLLHGDARAGATLHYMDDRADTGNIVFQDSFPVTEDLDLGLVYHLLFRMEKHVFVEGINRLIESDWNYEGIPQTRKGTYYTRAASDAELDFETMHNDELLRRIRAFGHHGQGCMATLANRDITILDADTITNPALTEEFANATPGSIVLEYDGKLLVKTLQGLLRIRAYSEDHNA